MKEIDHWLDWSKKVHELRLTGIVLTLLDGAAPVRYILSQGLFAFLPFVNSNTTPSWKAFAQMLEDPAAAQSFAAYLREE
jgi:hypothetical protein